MKELKAMAKVSGVKGEIGLAVCLADVSITETYRRVRYGHNEPQYQNGIQARANSAFRRLANDASHCTRGKHPIYCC